MHHHNSTIVLDPDQEEVMTSWDDYNSVPRRWWVFVTRIAQNEDHPFWLAVIAAGVLMFLVIGLLYFLGPQ